MGLSRPRLHSMTMRSIWTAPFLTRSLILASALILGTSPFAVAEGLGKVEITLCGGALSASGGFERQPVQGLEGSEEIEAKLGSGIAYWLSVSMEAYRPLSVELSYAHFTNNYLVDLYGYNPQDGERGYLTGEHNTSLGHFGASVVWGVLRGPIVPYVSGGLGWLMFIDAQAFAPHGAAGLKWFPTDHLGLRCDARIFSGHLEDTIDATVGPYGDTYAQADYSDDFTFKDVVVGLIYRF